MYNQRVEASNAPVHSRYMAKAKAGSTARLDRMMIWRSNSIRAQRPRKGREMRQPERPPSGAGEPSSLTARDRSRNAQCAGTARCG